MEGKKLKMVSYLNGPFFADEGLDKKQAIKNLRDKVYNSMVEEAKHSNYEKTIYKKK